MCNLKLITLKVMLRLASTSLALKENIRPVIWDSTEMSKSLKIKQLPTVHRKKPRRLPQSQRSHQKRLITLPTNKVFLMTIFISKILSAPLQLENISAFLTSYLSLLSMMFLMRRLKTRLHSRRRSSSSLLSLVSMISSNKKMMKLKNLPNGTLWLKVLQYLTQMSKLTTLT